MVPHGSTFHMRTHTYTCCGSAILQTCMYIYISIYILYLCVCARICVSLSHLTVSKMLMWRLLICCSLEGYCQSPFPCQSCKAMGQHVGFHVLLGPRQLLPDKHTVVVSPCRVEGCKWAWWQFMGIWRHLRWCTGAPWGIIFSGDPKTAVSLIWTWVIKCPHFSHHPTIRFHDRY